MPGTYTRRSVIFNIFDKNVRMMKINGKIYEMSGGNLRNSHADLIEKSERSMCE
jgi:hypothetical protein